MLKMKEKKDKVLETILNKMLEIARYSKTVQDILSEGNEEWYMSYTMTEEQEKEWLKWSEDYLVKNLRWNRTRAKKELGWVNLSYGLRIINYK